MFQFAGFASYSYVFTIRYRTSAVGCPIRKSPDQSLLATPQGLSQRATSFIASTRQGIRQMPLSRLNLNESVMRRDQSDARRVDRVTPTHSNANGSADPDKLTNPRRTGQSKRTSVGVLHSRIHDDKERIPMRNYIVRNGKFQISGPKIFTQALAKSRSTKPAEGTLVEVNGIEPMTSCLQSRRSPN